MVEQAPAHLDEQFEDGHAGLVWRSRLGRYMGKIANQLVNGTNMHKQAVVVFGVWSQARSLTMVPSSIASASARAHCVQFT